MSMPGPLTSSGPLWYTLAQPCTPSMRALVLHLTLPLRAFGFRDFSNVDPNPGKLISDSFILGRISFPPCQIET